MELLAQKLSPVDAPAAAKAISRFLERCAPTASAEGALSADVRGQLDAMRAALQRNIDEGGGGAAGGGGGEAAAATAAAAAAVAPGATQKHKKQKREE